MKVIEVNSLDDVKCQFCMKQMVEYENDEVTFEEEFQRYEHTILIIDSYFSDGFSFVRNDLWRAWMPPTDKIGDLNWLNNQFKKIDAHQFAENLPMDGTLIKADNGHNHFFAWEFKK
tara:strand:- start:166 stop:516 length:351 start_codon:yes stop_codon:yes gene_type:complete